MSNAKTMTIADVMTKSVISVDASMTVNGAAKEIFLGSTSNYVLHKSKKPVLIVK